MTHKKIISIIIFLISLGFLFNLNSFSVKAQTIDELKVLITQLQAQIVELQTKISLTRVELQKQPEQVKQATLEPEYTKGEIIIKLKPGASQRLDAKLSPQKLGLFSSTGNILTGIASLSELNKKYRVTLMEPVFKDLKREQLKTGKDYLTLFNETKQKYPDRAKSVGAESITIPNLLNIYKLTFSKDTDVLQVIKGYQENPSVEYAEPNYIMEFTATSLPDVPYIPNDYYVGDDQNPGYWRGGSWGQNYPDLWGLQKIQAVEAYNLFNTGSVGPGEGVVVAVIDSGVDYTHEDLANNIWINEDEIPNNGVDDDRNGYVDDRKGWDYVGSDLNNPVPDNDPMDELGHGTHCAGTIAAIGNNEKGIIGVAPYAKIMVLKVGGNSSSLSVSAAAQAIHYAADNGADILSNSWAGLGVIQTLTDAFNYVDQLGCISIAAAGNSNTDMANFTPANLSTVMAVAATDQNDVRSSFSNYGAEIDVAAPGGGSGSMYTNPSGQHYYVNILSLRGKETDMYVGSPNYTLGEFVSRNYYYRARGTSMACPHVAGLAAVVKSMYPTDSSDSICSRILAGVDEIDTLNPGFETSLGTGRINVYKSLTVEPKPLLKILYLEKDKIYPGQSTNLVIHLKNLWRDAVDVTATLTINNPFVTIQNSDTVFGDIPLGQTKANADDPFVFFLDPKTPFGEVINFELTLNDKAGYHKVLKFTVTTAFFVDVGAQTNLPLVYFLPTSLVMRDYDNDDYSDAVFIGETIGDAVVGLYKNLQDGSFLDTTGQAGLHSISSPWTAVFLDIENDGDQDLFIGSLGDDGSLLFANNGNGTFTDITETSSIGTLFDFAALAFDYNNDGLVDIFGGSNQTLFLLRNKGSNTFENVIQDVGLPEKLSLFDSQAVAFDYDNDKDQDLLLAGGDQYLVEGEHLSLPRLYRNNGDSTFTDVTSASSISVLSRGAQGVAVGDYNNDGYIDIFLISALEHKSKNILYKNNGNGTFNDVTAEARIPVLSTDSSWWGGNSFFDYDNDGDLDLYRSDDGGCAPTLFQNNGDGTFSSIEEMAFPGTVIPGEATVGMGDYNNDGALDIYAPAGLWCSGGAFFKNLKGRENNWIKIKLEGTVSNRDAYGARVYVKTGDLRQLREVYTSPVEAQPLHFGLSQANIIDEIEVHWPSGRIRKYSNVAVNQLLAILEEEKSLTVNLEAIPSSGTAPLNGVDFKATVSGTAQGTINYKFDCQNDGWDYTFDNISDNPKTIVDACDYSNAGTYTAKVYVGRQGLSAEDTTIIAVSPPQVIPPSVSTNEATLIEETTATLNGNITNTGGENCDQRGFDWGLTTNHGSSWTEQGTYGTGSFSRGITGLNMGTPYHFQAKAHNSSGWGYGIDKTFYTKPGDPSNLTATPQSQTQINLNWTKGTGADKTKVLRKIGTYPTSYSDGTPVYFDTGTSTSDTGLTCGTTYYYRIWAYDTESNYYSDGYSQASATTNDCSPIPQCSELNYPSNKWQRVWFEYPSGNCLGDSPDETSLFFDTNWGSGNTIAYGRDNYIQLKSSRTIHIDTAGTYRFYIGSDDGVRFYLDDVPRLEQWLVRHYTVDTLDINLTAGDHRVELDYFENTGAARFSFSYESVVVNPPALNVSPTTLTFTATQGGSNPSNQGVTVWNTGGGILSWTAADNQNWFSVSPTSYTSNSTTLWAIVNITGLSAGTYSGAIIVTGAAGTQNSPQPVTVNLAVTPAAQCPSLNFPSNKWQRVWFEYPSGNCLGDSPDETSLFFDTNWGSGNTIAYGRDNYIQLKSSRTIHIDTAGTYRFYIGSDDGVRFYLDDVPRLEQWLVRHYTVDTLDINLTAGDHRVELDYFENTGAARFSFSYEPLGCTNTASSMPTLSLPANGATGQPTSPTVSWNTVSSWGTNCAGNTNTYEVFLDTNSNPTTSRGTVAEGTTSKTISGLSNNTLYYWKVRVSNGALSADSSVWGFTTQPFGGQITWVSPTGHRDPENAYISEYRAYDDILTSVVWTSFEVSDAWCPFLELTHDPITVNKIRFYHRYSSYDKIDIDVFYNNSWNNVYEGIPSQNTYVWEEKDILGGSQTISGARIRYHVPPSSGGNNCFVDEFDFGKVGGTSTLPLNFTDILENIRNQVASISEKIYELLK